MVCDLIPEARWTFSSAKSILLFWHKWTISAPGIIINNPKFTLMRTYIKHVIKQTYNFGIVNFNPWCKRDIFFPCRNRYELKNIPYLLWIPPLGIVGTYLNIKDPWCGRWQLTIRNVNLFDLSIFTVSINRKIITKRHNAEMFKGENCWIIRQITRIYSQKWTLKEINDHPACMCKKWQWLA